MVLSDQNDQSHIAYPVDRWFQYHMEDCLKKKIFCRPLLLTLENKRKRAVDLVAILTCFYIGP